MEDTSQNGVRLYKAMPSLVDAVKIAALGFVREQTSALTEDVDDHLKNGQIVYHIFVGDDQAGFAIFATYDDILYLSGIILVPKYQGKGIGPEVVKSVAGLLPECKYLALRTQSLRMYLAACKLCSESHPALESLDNIPEPFAGKGQRVAKIIGSNFPIHKGWYGGALYGQKPKYHDSALQTKWDRICSFEQGDAMIFIGRLL